MQDVRFKWWRQNVSPIKEEESFRRDVLKPGCGFITECLSRGIIKIRGCEISYKDSWKTCIYFVLLGQKLRVFPHFNTVYWSQQPNFSPVFCLSLSPLLLACLISWLLLFLSWFPAAEAELSQIYKESSFQLFVFNKTVVKETMTKRQNQVMTAVLIILMCITILAWLLMPL